MFFMIMLIIKRPTWLIFFKRTTSLKVTGFVNPDGHLNLVS